MRIYRLHWDEINIEHIIGEHNLSPEEVEDVCFGLHYAIRARNRRQAVYGQTGGGKYIVVILERLYGSCYRPITAFGMNRKEQRKYKSIMGQGGD